MMSRRGLKSVVGRTGPVSQERGAMGIFKPQSPMIDRITSATFKEEFAELPGHCYESIRFYWD